MDRNGKKSKAARPDLHAERSDTKSQSRDVLGRTNVAMHAPGERPGAEGPEGPGAKGGRKSHRR